MRSVRRSSRSGWRRPGARRELLPRLPRPRAPQLRSDYEESDLTEAGLTVFSTLDPLLQQKAEAALDGELERLDRSGAERGGPRGRGGRHHAADRRSAAMVGGRRAAFDGFNRALDAKRPIGSLAKPLVYLAALETGRYTPVTFLADEPLDLKLPNGDTGNRRTSTSSSAAR